MTPIGSSRHASIDILRATAIVLMVVIHFVENLSGWFPGNGGLFAGAHRAWWLPSGFAAPMFTFLSGVSYRIWAAARERQGLGTQEIAKVTVRRGLFLIGLGFAFNVLVWLPEDTFNWDILTLIGSSLLSLAIARRMPDAVILLTVVLVIAVAPALRETAGYSEYWTAGFYDYDFTLADVALGWLVTGYFPMFPWLAFPLAGYAVAPRLGFGGGPLPSERGTLAVAVGLVGTAAGLVVGPPFLPVGFRGDFASAWTMFPASTSYVLGTLGGTTVALAALHALLDGHVARWSGLVAWATTLSRHALSIYLIHHVVHIWPLWAWSLATRGDATALWQVAMPPWASLTFAVVFLIGAALASRRLDGRRAITAESLMRWVCD